TPLRSSTTAEESDALPGETRVPEVQEWAGLEALQTACHDQAEEIAHLDAPDVLVEHRLDALDERAPLVRVALAQQLAEQALLLLVAPPAGPIALQIRREAGIGRKGDAGGEDVPQVGIGAPLHERGPVQHLQIDLEADLLHLLARDERRVVHVHVL